MRGFEEDLNSNLEVPLSRKFAETPYTSLSLPLGRHSVAPLNRNLAVPLNRNLAVPHNRNLAVPLSVPTIVPRMRAHYFWT